MTNTYLNGSNSKLNDRMGKIALKEYMIDNCPEFKRLYERGDVNNVNE